jgi:hypothetical protein
MRRRLAALASLAASVTTAGTPGTEREIYRRVTILEDRVGRADLRSAFGARIDVPIECPDGGWGCSREEVYDEVWTLELSIDRRELSGDEVMRTVEPAGTIHLALAFSESDLAAFGEELHDRLRRLSANSFVQPFAGLGSTAPPFDISTVAARAEKPAWLCLRDAGKTRITRFARETRTEPGGGESVTLRSDTYDDARTSLCDDLAAATAGAEPERIETLAVPRRMLEVSVLHRDAVRIDAEDPAALAPRPAGVQLLQAPAQAGQSEAKYADDTGTVLAQHVFGGRRLLAVAAPAVMPIGALDNAWLQRFTVEELEHVLGVEPTERRVGRRELQVAYLATLPADRIEDDAGSTSVAHVPFEIPRAREVRPERPAEIDREGFLKALLARLDRHDGSPDEVLDECVARPEAGLGAGTWIAVLCTADGSARYTLPPTPAGNRVLNADLFCAALEARLP